jgi:hypothetical protein
VSPDSLLAFTADAEGPGQIFRHPRVCMLGWEEDISRIVSHLDVKNTMQAFRAHSCLCRMMRIMTELDKMLPETYQEWAMARGEVPCKRKGSADPLDSLDGQESETTDLGA